MQITTPISRLSPDALNGKKETAFTVHPPNAGTVTAWLHTVDLPAEGRVGTDRATLYFDVPCGGDLHEETCYVCHPRLEPFRARFERVQAGGRYPTRTGYRAVVVE